MEARDKKILVQSVCAVLIIVVLFNVYSGITVSKIGIPGLIDIEFNSGDKPGSEEKPGQQDSPTSDEQESVVDDPPIIKPGNTRDISNDDYESLDEDDVYGAIPPEITGDTVIDLNGMWYGDDGSEYEISHDGGSVYFTEYGLYGATAQGSGEFQGKRLNLEYETVFGTFGTAILDVSENGRVLSGRANDITSGSVTQLYLTRY
ncbi:hypothetical protein [Rhodohalobacter sp. 8-1]|uniref:hypothetical protein n=1 Tax=Rhodohalobacter sp. 8-1 TaxID=3131972 RepID=UPI0030EE42C9